MNYIEKIQDTNKTLIDLADKLLRKEEHPTVSLKREIYITTEAIKLIRTIIEEDLQ